MRVFASILLAGFMLPSVMLANPVTIATDPSNPPCSELDASGELRGFERAFGDALCERLQLDCVWETRPREALIAGLVAGDYNVVLAALPIEGDFGPGVSMTQAYLYPTVYATVGLAGKELVMATGTVSVLGERDMTEWGRMTGRTLITYRSLDAALEATLGGDIDGVWAPKELLVPLVETAASEYGYIYNDHKLDSGFAMALREQDADLRFRFEDAIFEMGEDGSLEALAMKQFGPGVATK